MCERTLEVIGSILGIEIGVGQVQIELDFAIGIFLEQFLGATFLGWPRIGGIANWNIQFVVDENFRDVKIKIGPRHGVFDHQHRAGPITDLGTF